MNKMFLARDEITYIEADSEKAPLIAQDPTAPIYEYKQRTPRWRRFARVEMKLPKTQTIAGIMLGLLLLCMILMLVAEAIRSSHRHVPFLIDVTTTDSDTGIFISPELVGFPNDAFKKAWKDGEGLAIYRQNLEKMLAEKGVVPKHGSSSSLLQTFQKGDKHKSLEDCAIIVEHVKRELGGCLDPRLLPARCLASKPINCNTSYPYRTYNGSCNNLGNSDWGMALTPFRRMMRPEYADGVAMPRAATDGTELPNARYLSNKLYTHRSKPQCNSTVITLYFGLFIDHDIIRITSKTGHNGVPISCCNPEVIADPSLRHPECMAIVVPEEDPFYGPRGVKCLDFVRSASVPGLCAGEREQMNSVTSFLDASGVYGSFDDKNKPLRQFQNGLLKVCWINNTAMLPPAHHISYRCGLPTAQQFCFEAGDMRVNEQVELTAIHAMFMREHNRVALKLGALNPQWDDEKLFQEARRIVIAELQHLTYNEFLPVLLGEDVMQAHGLVIDPKGNFEGYDPDSDPSIYNVFGGAAFRVGHSLIEGMLDLIGPGYSTQRKIPLHTAFLNPHIFYEKGMDLLLRGLVRERAASVDSYITDEVRNRLFQPRNEDYGMDLSAIGIQRGRDQGLSGYAKWRKFCGLPEANSWEDLFNFMDSAHVQRLKSVYKSVGDIDLIPGALSEIHLPGALVGPVHACLIARQFHRTRVGDRFWFEVKGQPGSFTAAQLSEIYKSSMARLLCDNSDRMEEIQRWALRGISDENPTLNCTDIPSVDFKMWKES